MASDIKQIARYYGINAQLIKTIEELSELIQAIANYFNKFTGNNNIGGRN